MKKKLSPCISKPYVLHPPKKEGYTRTVHSLEISKGTSLVMNVCTFVGSVNSEGESQLMVCTSQHLCVLPLCTQVFACTVHSMSRSAPSSQFMVHFNLYHISAQVKCIFFFTNFSGAQKCLHLNVTALYVFNKINTVLLISTFVHWYQQSY